MTGSVGTSSTSPSPGCDSRESTTRTLCPRPAFAYLTVPRWSDPGTEIPVRRALAEYARLEGLDLRSVFVDVLDESPYAFAALRELLRRRSEVRTVVLPDLGHVAHLPAVAHLSQAGLARFLGAAVLLVTPGPSTSSWRWSPAAHDVPVRNGH